MEGTGTATTREPANVVHTSARILIVDDDQADRDALATLLASAGFILTTAGSGDDAIALVAKHPFDLILLDVVMPGLDGYAVMRSLKGALATADIPVIMVSALDDRRSLIRGLRAGAADFLRKPVEPTELRARVENLLKLKAHGDQQNEYGHQLEGKVDARTAELIASERLYRETFDSAPVGIVHVGMDGRWLRVNQRLCTLLGYSREALLTPEIQALVLAEVKTAERPADEQVSTEEQYRRHDGTLIWVRCNMTVHHHSDGRPDHLILVLEDITEHRALEAQVRQAGKMDALGSLAAGLAHDFNNLLSIIVSYSEMASADLDPKDSLCSDLRAIHSAGQRAAVLTRQLLAFSRNQVLCPQVVDLDEVVDGMRDILRRLIREDVTLQISRNQGAAKILIDRSQLEQIIMNLAINARDAMPGGGTLTIESTRTASTPREVVLTMRDTGHGMDAETQARMFDAFFTTKPLGIGTGLGLSTVFGIVKQSGGTISADSEVGKGTTFKICFPEVGVAAAVPVPVRTPTRLARGTETILLVEDDPAVRVLTRTLLDRTGYTVLEASSVEDASTLCDHHPRPIDLLLTDIVMPGASGWQLAAALRTKRPEMKVLYMSGYAEGAAFADTEAGTRAFLEKPITPERLSQKVREALGGRLQSSTESAGTPGEGAPRTEGTAPAPGAVTGRGMGWHES
ncbi:MAG: response regulator [Kofleriaceae bacterium]